MSNYQGYGLPERLTLAYQRIPPRARRIWSMGSSSSELALTAIRDSHRGARHWTAFFQHTRGVRFLPGYAAGAGIRRAGLAMPLLGLDGARMAHWLDGANPRPRPRGSLGAFWGLPFMGSSSVWYDPPGTVIGWKDECSLENKELPDWFPTTGMHGPNAAWHHSAEAGWWAGGPFFAALLVGFTAGLAGQVWDQPKGYPANPPPSLNWNGKK